MLRNNFAVEMRSMKIDEFVVNDDYDVDD